MRRISCAVIITRDRPEEFAQCLRAIWPQVDHVIVISHGTEYARDHHADGISVIDYAPEIPNISMMWNLGLLEAEAGAYAEPHDVAVLNDDAVVPPGWFDRITDEMRATGAVLGCSDQHGHTVSQHLRTFDRPDIRRRLTGFAFVLDSESGLRLDEQFRWWWGDTDLDWRARQAGGLIIVPGIPVQHPPNGGGTTTGVLARIAREDRDRFIAKWGSAPW